MGGKTKMPKISKDHEYVLDTSVLLPAILNYAEGMSNENPHSTSDYQNIHDVCFEVLLQLANASIALDTDNIIKQEYERLVFNTYPNDFPTQWYSRMERTGKIIPKDITIDGKRKSEMKNFFGLSKVDCCLIHVAQFTTTKKVLHREQGLTNAAGYANQYFEVVTVNVMRD